MKHLLKLALAAAVGVGAMTMVTGDASAAIVCNGAGECWHAHHPGRFRHEWGLVVHPDRWHWRHNEHYVWREHPGRGYWRDGVWITF